MISRLNYHSRSKIVQFERKKKLEIINYSWHTKIWFSPFENFLPSISLFKHVTGNCASDRIARKYYITYRERREDASKRMKVREIQKERERNASKKSLSMGSLIEARDDALSATFALIFPPVHRLPSLLVLSAKNPFLSASMMSTGDGDEEKTGTAGESSGGQVLQHYWFWLLLLRRWIIAIAIYVPLREWIRAFYDVTRTS